MTIVLESMNQKQNVETTENQGLETFSRNNAQNFKGGFNLDGAQSWIAEIEKFFIAMSYVDANRVTFTTFMLVEEAENWWRFTKQQLEYEGRQITWEIFKQNFLEKYFPEDLRRRKEVEFLNLRQGTMSMGEYAAKFDELSTFCPHFHERVDECSHCSKFESGLRADIKQTVSYLEISSFSILVNRCRIF